MFSQYIHPYVELWVLQTNKFSKLQGEGTSWAPLERNSRSLMPSPESLLKERMISYVAAAIVRLTVPVSSITYRDCGIIAIGQRESTELDLWGLWSEVQIRKSQLSFKASISSPWVNPKISPDRKNMWISTQKMVWTSAFSFFCLGVWMDKTSSPGSNKKVLNFDQVSIQCTTNRGSPISTVRIWMIW